VEAVVPVNALIDILSLDSRDKLALNFLYLLDLGRFCVFSKKSRKNAKTGRRTVLSEEKILKG
jgi:hypothetical protein